jgi:hypothetical protein
MHFFCVISGAETSASEAALFAETETWRSETLTDVTTPAQGRTQFSLFLFQNPCFDLYIYYLVTYYLSELFFEFFRTKTFNFSKSPI